MQLGVKILCLFIDFMRLFVFIISTTNLIFTKSLGWDPVREFYVWNEYMHKHELYTHNNKFHGPEMNKLIQHMDNHIQLM